MNPYLVHFEDDPGKTMFVVARCPLDAARSVAVGLIPLARTGGHIKVKRLTAGYMLDHWRNATRTYYVGLSRSVTCVSKQP